MIVEQILKFLECKGISKSKFYKETGLSNGFLDKVKDIGHSKLLKILSTYPEINPVWLILNKGEMLIQKDISSTILEDKHKKIRFKDENLYLSVEEIISRNVVNKLLPTLTENNLKLEKIIEFINYVKLSIEIDNEIDNDEKVKNGSNLEKN